MWLSYSATVPARFVKLRYDRELPTDLLATLLRARIAYYDTNEAADR